MKQSPLTPVAPGAWLGMLGGGQLGRMWVHAAQSLGYRCMVLDPDPDSPAGRVAEQHLAADYLDVQALRTLAQTCAAVSTEFENVPAQALAQLAESTRVTPHADAVAIAQDRAKEKAHFQACGVPVAPHRIIESPEQLAEVPDHLLPGILKTTRLGYDGKGQARVKTREELNAAWQRLQDSAGSVLVPCVLEQQLPLKGECSVVLARGFDGSHTHLPVQLNLHRQGILALTEVAPGLLEPALEHELVQAALAIALKLNYVGVLCVEFFIIPRPKGGATWVVNEIAPRPHNSGHHSMDACDLSQFELQARCMAQLPLREVCLHSATAMINLLGDVWYHDGQAHEPNWSAVLAVPGTHLHLYGKAEARVGRKMGHLNLTGRDLAQVRMARDQVARILGIAPFIDSPT
ncbi:MAG: 5-(carboxyamino)imidazole ribonucleotide synthase [Alphaproteobacteria bacterium]|nr:5-(carboxyamino)imidazole ribonucleotide synthase [Alphaproteobacteria bacterium]